MNVKTLADDVVETLKSIANEFTPVCFANSLGAEDMVLFDLISKHAPSIEVFCLDTGRLPAETYDLLQRVKLRYELPISVFLPNAERVEAFVNANGPNAFYETVALRKACCEVRKIEPLKRALTGKRAWICGLRRDQAVTRRDLPVREWDTVNGLEKFSPLAEWSVEDVWVYIHTHDVPYNTLHDRNYPSIGCEPCTRAVSPGEDLRAGRWWWEQPESKECGLHGARAVQIKGELVGKVAVEPVS